MRSLRFLCLIAVALLSTQLRAAVNEYNGTPCTIKKVMVKQYIFQDGVLGNCPAWLESVAYGATLVMTDYYQSWSSPDQWGNPQPHSYEVRYEKQYDYHVSAPCPYTISSTTVVTSPSNRQRTKIGVGEVVTVTLSPTPTGTVSWTASAGSLPATSAGQATFVAPETASATGSTITVTATVGGNNYVRTFQVVRPAAYIEKAPNTATRHEFGVPSTGFWGSLFVGPDDVNFSHLKIREGQCSASAHGFLIDSHGVVHQPTSSWGVPGNPVSGKGSPWAGDDVYTATYVPGPFSNGDFTWPIPWEYKISDNGTVHNFDTVTHHAEMNSAGTMNLSKGAVSVSSALNDDFSF